MLFAPPPALAGADNDAVSLQDNVARADSATLAAGHFIGVQREDSRLPAAPCRGNTTRTKEPQEDNEAAAAAN